MKDRLVLAAGAALFCVLGCGSSGTQSTPPPPSVHNEWSWMGGAQTFNQGGVYGTRGTASATNIPGARTYASSGRDSAGDVWLFGGYGFSASATAGEGDLNDLWEYTNNEWTWISGSNQPGQNGNYGTEGVAASSNVPGGRYWAASWTDSSGNFWLFGGIGRDSQGLRGNLNDLWEYSHGQWKWVAGSNLAAYAVGSTWTGPGIYGVKGVAAPSNSPGARVNASTWTDAAGNLWLFGGSGSDDGTAGVGDLNDLWKYSNGEWTWMAGSSVANQFGVYGAVGTPNPANSPGARFGAATWIDSAGNLWLFGGDGQDIDGQRCQQTGSPCKLSDLWRFSPSSGEWTWMGGPDQSNEPGVYGSQGAAAAANIPSPRSNGTAWIDLAGNFWLFGGDSPSDMNDLWKYSGGEWMWVSGSNESGQAGTYGTLGTPASSNVPGCRDGAVGWTDKSGDLWLFGGQAATCVGNDKLSDLWEYQP